MFGRRLTGQHPCVELPDAIQCANWARKAVMLSIRKRWRVAARQLKHAVACARCPKNAAFWLASVLQLAHNERNTLQRSMDAIAAPREDSLKIEGGRSTNFDAEPGTQATHLPVAVRGVRPHRCSSAQHRSLPAIAHKPLRRQRAKNKSSATVQPAAAQ